MCRNEFRLEVFWLRMVSDAGLGVGFQHYFSAYKDKNKYSQCNV